ncbi:MAG: Type 1 glutamine amidotransferase-like domain-containing protein [Faecousia sp.]
MTDMRAEETKNYFEKCGISFEKLWVLDGRNQKLAAELVNNSNLIILSGGHVPTQNRFFRDIALGEILKSFTGVVIAWSAGSMNSAETVYAHVELPGEAVDPDYKRFLPGLGLTKTMILPHYQLIRNDVLDGLRIFEDVAYPDSFGRRFFCLVDGSYLYIHNGVEELYGEAYLIENGEFCQISKSGVILKISQK